MIFRRRNKNPQNAEMVARDLIMRSDLFDATWYLDQYPDVASAGFDPVLHYVRHGAEEGRNPGPWFDTAKYLEGTEGSVEGCNPLLHYLKHRSELVFKRPQEKRRYSNFAEFLKFTATNPIIAGPFKEEDRRCFAVMEAIGAHLVKSLRSRESIKISIIMPVRNRLPTLPVAIDSVLLQRYKNFELIIIDDASDDGSRDFAEQVASQDPRVKVIRFDQHIGVCAARNAGLEWATGDIVAYLDSDNSWLEDFLGAAVGAFELLVDADAIYGGQYIYAESDVDKLSAVRFGPMNFSLLEQHNYIDLNCFLHRRTLIDLGLRFNNDLQRLVDWDFILRASKSFRIVSVPVLLSRYYLHAAENTITKTVPISSHIEKISSHVSPKLDPIQFPSLAKRLCVVIPSYQALPFLQECIGSLQPYIDNDKVEVVIVDNNSSFDVRDYLQSMNRKSIKLILNDINYGFSYAVNQGVAAASDESDVVILNNDARLGPRSLEILQTAAYRAPDIAISVPRQIIPAGTNDIGMHVPYANPGLDCDVSLSAHHENIESIDIFHDGREVELSFAPFFCVYIKREAWNLCGGLDHENGRHYRSDRIMCDFLRMMLNRRIVYTPDARVYHGVQVATNELGKNGINGGNDYHDMLVKNIWPPDLMKNLGIHKRPWQVD